MQCRNSKTSMVLSMFTIGKVLMELFPELQKHFLREKIPEKINTPSIWMSSKLGPRTKLGSSDIRTQEEQRHLTMCLYPTAMTDVHSNVLIK